MQTEVNIGKLLFKFGENHVEIFQEENYVGDVSLRSAEWEEFVNAASKLCQCGGGCGCSRV